MKYGKYILWFLALLPLILWRDFTPDNELRYLNIVDEALREGHLFAFYNHGIPYADKPPLYLWILMAIRSLCGSHNMFGAALFSVIPGLVILSIMNRWTQKEATEKNRLSGQLMLLTSGYYLGAMVVLRMDMLMSLFIVLALYTFYKMYQGKGTQKDTWLLSIYIFLALFTKGPYGVMIPLASILAFLLIKKQYKQIGRYLGWRTLLPLLLLCAIWFGAVYIEGGKEYLNNLLFNQTVNRAVDSFSHKKAFYYYLETIWYSLAPWSLFYVGILLAAIKSGLIRTDLEKFFLTVFGTSFVMLSLISAKLEIYLLPTYPFLFFLVMLLLSRMQPAKWMKWLIGIPAGVFALIFPVFCVFIWRTDEISFLNNLFVYLACASLTLTGISALVFLHRNPNLNKGINILAIGLLIAIFIGSFSIPYLNKEIGYTHLAERGKTLARENNINSYSFYKLSRAENMKTLLGKSIDNIGNKETDYRTELRKKKNTILFLRNKDIQKDDSLQNLIKNKKCYTEGRYSIVVWK